MDVFALPIEPDPYQLPFPTIQAIQPQISPRAVRVLTDEERLQRRDVTLFRAVYDHNGVLTDTQLQRVSSYGEKAYARRILWLAQARFLDRRKALTGEMVNFLKPQGAMKVASVLGAGAAQFKWRRPGERWLEVPHDVASNEYAIALERSLKALPQMTL